MKNKKRNKMRRIRSGEERRGNEQKKDFYLKFKNCVLYFDKTSDYDR